MGAFGDVNLSSVTDQALCQFQAEGTVETADKPLFKQDPPPSGSTTPERTVNQPRHRPKSTRLLVVLLLLVLGTISYFAWQFFTAQADHGKLRVSGRIEGYETNIGAKIGGRVNFIAVREGDFVKVNDMIVRLSDDDIQAQLRGAKARLNKAYASKEQAEEQIGVIKSLVTQSNLNRQQAIEDTKGKIVQAEAQVASAKATLGQAEAQLSESTADLKLAQLRKERYDTLAVEGAVMQDDADQADTKVETSKAIVKSRHAAVEAARKQFIAAEGNLTQARSTRLNPPIRLAELFSSKRQLGQSQAQLKAAEEEIKNAKAAVEEIEANIAYLNIVSPIDAVVTARAVEPGAVVVAGQTVLSIINLDTVYLRAYVPEGDIGKIRVGQDALVYLDSAPKKGWPSKVIEIDPQASFTPENIYFKDDRVKQVFGIKIAIHDPQRFPKPGMPADADIILDSKQ